MYRYQFKSTIEDLLAAEEADRIVHSVRAPFLWTIVLLGIAWLAAGVVAFDWSNPTWRPAVWVLLGIAVIYYFVIRLYIRRSRIKKGNAPQQDLVLEFHDDGINLGISGLGDLTRKWEELVEFVDSKKGIIFYFNDSVVNWLPDRVFRDKEERKKFIEFLHGRQLA